MKPPEPRYPLQPLIDALGHNMTRPHSTGRGEVDRELRGPAGLAVRLGVSSRTILRWQADGIPESWADRVALRVDLHPAIVWPDEYFAEALADEPELSDAEAAHAAKVADAIERRALLGLTRKALAQMVGVASQTFDKWESGQNWPSVEMEARWFDVLDGLERERLAQLLERHWIRG